MVQLIIRFLAILDEQSQRELSQEADMSMTVHIFMLVHFCTAIVHDEGIVTVHIFMLAHFCTASLCHAGTSRGVLDMRQCKQR